uniref:Transposase n=1 Tax=Syphacia muris TaxID=451379 RepID=A0A0N5AYS0_9BILA
MVEVTRKKDGLVSNFNVGTYNIDLKRVSTAVCVGQEINRLFVCVLISHNTGGDDDHFGMKGGEVFG